MTEIVLLHRKMKSSTFHWNKNGQWHWGIVFQIRWLKVHHESQALFLKLIIAHLCKNRYKISLIAIGVNHSLVSIKSPEMLCPFIVCDPRPGPWRGRSIHILWHKRDRDFVFLRSHSFSTFLSLVSLHQYHSNFLQLWEPAI